MFPLKHVFLGLYGIGISGLLACVVQDNNEKDYLAKPTSASYKFTSERNEECGESFIWKSSDEFNKKNSKGKNFEEWGRCTRGMMNKHLGQTKIQNTAKKSKSTASRPKTGWNLRRTTQWR